MPLSSLWLIVYLNMQLKMNIWRNSWNKIIMQTLFPPISTYKLIKRLRMNRRDSGRVSPPLCLKPREISKCWHHRAFFNFLTLNDFIRKLVCTVSLYVWGRLGEWSMRYLSRNTVFFPLLLPAKRYHHHILMKLQTNLSCLVQKLRDNKAAEITEGPG